MKQQNFNGLNFSGVIRKSDKLEKCSISRKSSDSVSPSLYPSFIVPQSIFNETTGDYSSANQTVFFVLYKDTRFFRESSADSTKMWHRLNSLVISRGIKGLSVTNLSVSVHIALPNDRTRRHEKHPVLLLGFQLRKLVTRKLQIWSFYQLCNVDGKIIIDSLRNLYWLKKIMILTFTYDDKNGNL